MGIPLNLFIVVIISATLLYLYNSISHKVGTIADTSQQHIQSLCRSNTVQFNKFLETLTAQLNAISKLTLTQLKNFQIQAAEDLLQVTRQPFEKAFNTGDKRTLKVWLKRQGAVSDVEEVSFLNHQGVVRFSSHEQYLNRTLDPQKLKELNGRNDTVKILGTDGLETFIPRKIERKCIRCHAHRDWQGKIGDNAGYFYLRVSTAAYEQLKTESATFIEKIKQENHVALNNLLAQNEAEATAITEENRQHISGINHSNARVFGISVLAITAASLTIVFFLVKMILTRPIRKLTTMLDGCSDTVAGSSEQLTAASLSLADRTNGQAASIEETISSLESLASMTKLNAQHAQESDSLMNESLSIVSRADHSMQQLTGAMNEIATASKDISNIVKTIEGIAFQTNLLALNASVEAARAGEAGAGFAVVAQEVRNLAMKAAQAANSTEALIQQTGNKVAEGTILLSKTNQDFSAVSSSSAKVAGMVGEIAAASIEQANGIDQISQIVSEMGKIIQQDAGDASESANTSRLLNSQSQEMKEMVGALTGLVDGAAAKGNSLAIAPPERNELSMEKA